jgi:hypothetical protein
LWIQAEYAQLAAGTFHRAVQATDKCRFTGAIWAQQAEAFSRVDFQIATLEGLDRPKAFSDTPGNYDRFRGLIIGAQAPKRSRKDARTPSFF